MKTITLPLEEYNELLQDQNDKKRLMEELEADAKDRGFFVQYITQCWEKKDPSGWYKGYDYIREKNTLNIVSKDKVLADAQKEIDRLTKLSEELSEKNTILSNENNELKLRGFFALLFKKGLKK